MLFIRSQDNRLINLAMAEDVYLERMDAGEEGWKVMAAFARTRRRLYTGTQEACEAYFERVVAALMAARALSVQFAHAERDPAPTR